MVTLRLGLDAVSARLRVGAEMTTPQVWGSWGVGWGARDSDWEERSLSLSCRRLWGYLWQEAREAHPGHGDRGEITEPTS